MSGNTPGKPSHILLSSCDPSLASYFRFIDKELRENSRYQEQIIRYILYALILEISGEYDAQYNLSTGAELKSNKLTDRFFHLLSVYYKENRTVRFYADKLNVTPKHLSTSIRKATGRHVLEWMHEAVLIEAKMLLRTTNMAIYEIADALNFSCSSAFVQFFKKHTGTTPGTFLMSMNDIPVQQAKGPHKM